MTNYIPIIGLSILAIGAVYKLISKKDVTESEEEDPFDGPVQKNCREYHKGDNLDTDLANEAYKEREEIKGRVINDHIADIMNIKKKK